MRALVDVESLIYKAAVATEDLIQSKSDKDLYTTFYRVSKGKEYLDNVLNDIMGVTGSDKYLLVLGSSRNFRKVINPTYKANRSLIKPHPMVSILKKEFMATHPYYYIDWLEADDTVRILYEEDPFNNIVVSIDKDLKTFPCSIYNPDKPDDGVVKVSAKDAVASFMKQLLMGDTTDGYKGLPGVGPSTATKILSDMSEPDIEHIKTIYEEKSSFIDFCNVYNMARIISKKDYFEGSGIKLYKGYFDFEKGERVERL